MKSSDSLNFIGSNNFAHFPTICLETFDAASVEKKANCLQFGATFSESAPSSVLPEIISKCPFKTRVYPLFDFKVQCVNFGSTGDESPIGLSVDLNESGHSEITASKRLDCEFSPVIIRLRSISYLQDVEMSSELDTWNKSGNLTKNSDDYGGDPPNIKDHTGYDDTSASSSTNSKILTVKFVKQVRWFLCSQALESEKIISKIAFPDCDCNSNSSSGA